MSSLDSSPTGQRPGVTSEERRVLAATLVGTTIEWYDFFIYAQAAGLVLGPLFLAPLAKENPALAQIVSLATIGISFLFRPIGAIVAGELGDRLGRKKMLVFTLVMMGAATALIGVLPTYQQVGVLAPVMLIILRILQGFSAGGEWGGAALMAVEHAPVSKRGLFGAYPQIGVPVGMILATAVLWVLTTAFGPAAFTQWGWRIPFLLSVVLIVVGYLIRLAVEESPVFLQMAQRKRESSAPLRQLFRKNSKEVILTALIFIANNAAGYMVIAYFIAYGAKTLKLPHSDLLFVSMLGAVGWLIFTFIGGALSDRIGRIRTFQIGYAGMIVWAVPTWLLIDTKNLLLFFVAIFVLSFTLGLSYGPQAALYAEMFPARVRYSGVSIGYAIGSILGGAFAATIAEALVSSFHSSIPVGIYLAVLALISLIAVSAVKETRGVDLNDQEVHNQYLREHPDEGAALGEVAGEAESPHGRK